MKNYILALFLICGLGLVACKKKNNDYDALATYAGQTIINVHKVFGKNALVSYVLYYPKAGAVSRLQIKKSKETDWNDVKTYTDPNSIPIDGLTIATDYDLRVVLSDQGREVYSPVTSFTTQSVWIDMARFFAVHPKIHNGGNEIASFEGAHYEISGEGFAGMESVNVVFEAVDNPSDKMVIPATIKSDALLSFDLPKDCIPNAPYLAQKAYHMTVGDVLMVSYNSYMAGTFDYQANVLIQNRDLIIDSFSAAPYTCKVMRVGGYFGPHEKQGVLPDSLYNITMKVLDRKLIVRSGGAKVKEITIVAEGNVYCDGLGIAYVDESAINNPLLQFQETKLIALQSSLPSGSYTIQVEQLYADGTKGISPEYTISF